jgi:hypothetical protein
VRTAVLATPVHPFQIQAAANEMTVQAALEEANMDHLRIRSLDVCYSSDAGGPRLCVRGRQKAAAEK